MYNFENWIRRDMQGSTIYYGYSANENAADSDSNWSIMRLTTVGTVDSVKWSNGTPSSGISTWDNRIQSFQSPSSISLTYSQYPLGRNTAIRIGWNEPVGVDTYQVKISEDLSGKILNDGGHQIYSVNGNPAITSVVNNNFYIYKFGNIGVTYSVTVTGVNVIGSTSSNVKISV